MNWKPQLFKPKWQHKDAGIRLRAVSTDQHPELISRLFDIAATDADSRVRCAAIRRLHPLEKILQLCANETDPQVHKLLTERVHQLVSSSDASRPALELRLQVINTTTDKPLIAHLARHAPEPELRRAAIARLERQGLLGDCSIEDEDAGIRQFAASRITQQSTLKRVIEGLRTRDKALHKQLQQRLHEELLAQADAGAIQREALKICIALEQLNISQKVPDNAAVETLQAAWQRIAKTATASMAQRYQRVCASLATPSPVPPPEPTPPPVPTPSPVTTPALDPPAPPVAPVTSDASPDKAAATVANSPQSKHARDLQQAREYLTQLQHELEDGALHKALQTRTKLQQLEKDCAENSAKNVCHQKGWQAIHRDLAAKLGRLRELRDWQHWSNNKVRKRLISEMEVLPQADLHPDALLDRIKSLQAEWRALEDSEQIPGDKHYSAAPWMWRKFNSAGHTAFDTARPFLVRRSEIQSRHAQTLASFCKELEQLSRADTPDWQALGKALNQGHKYLHSLNDIPARERHKFARKLKTSLDQANAIMQAHYGLVEKEKLRLIRAASQLLHIEDRSEAIAQAKSLQTQWKSAGSLWRSREQALWTQFRDHLDPLFAELKSRQDADRAALEEQLAVQKSLCTALQSTLESDADLPAQHGKVQGLQEAWKDIQKPDRRLQQSFQKMLQEYRQKVDASKRESQQQAQQRRWLKSALLHEMSQAAHAGSISQKLIKRVQQEWPAETGKEPAEQQMDQQFQDWLNGEIQAPDTDQQQALIDDARHVCIVLEFLAALPSPHEEREQRMKFQVDRLAESMSGGPARRPAIVEAQAAEASWLTMYALPEPVYSTFAKRIKLALNTIMENN